MAEKKKDALEKVKSEEIEKKPGELEITKPGETIDEKVVKLVEGAGTITFNKKQRDILFGPIKEEDIEIRSDGLIYSPWMEYVTRLRDAFSGNWAILPDDKPRFGEDRKSIMWGFYLFIDGKPYGYAIGEQEYFPDSAAMSWSDACEGAKSNALMRLCKGLGISLELWKPSFIKKWKAKFAEQYYDDYKKKKLWRKKSEKVEKESKAKAKKEKVKDEAPPNYPEVPPEQQTEPSKEPQAKGPSLEDIVKEIQKDLKTYFGNKEYPKKYPRFKRFLEDLGREKDRRFVGVNNFGKQSLHLGDLESIEKLSLNMNWARERYVEWEKEFGEQIDKEEKEEKGFAGSEGEDPFE